MVGDHTAVACAAVKIYGLGLCKNEDDIVGSVVEHALGFCDKVIVLDNGSTDGSWQVITDLAERFPGRVVPFGPVDEPFFDGMRSKVWDAYFEELGEDGWWYYLDADEFLEGDPEPVLERALASGHDSVKGWIVQFRFTDVDLATWERGEEDISLPVQQRRLHYRTDWREYRFIRNFPVARWENPDSYLPRRALNPTKERVFVRHYQFRDPDQIQKRTDARYNKTEFFGHVTSPSWRDVVSPASRCAVHVEGRPFKLHPGNLYRHRLKTLVRKLTGGKVRV